VSNGEAALILDVDKRKMEIRKLSISQLIRIGFFAGIGAAIPITIIKGIDRMPFRHTFRFSEF